MVRPYLLLYLTLPTLRQFVAAALLFGMCWSCGCSPSPKGNQVEPANLTAVEATTSSPSHSKTGTGPSVPVEPPFRDLDFAADQELRSAFGDDRDRARQQYAGQRWRFRARIEGGAGNSTYLVVPEGLQQILVRMTSDEEAAKLIRLQTYTIEATVEDGLSRTFVEGVVIDDPSGSPGVLPPGDTREVWRYTGAPTVLPGQKSDGTFRKQMGDRWIEDRVASSQEQWRELARTPDYVELVHPDGLYHVRLGATGAEYRFGRETDWRALFPGQWVAKDR